MNLKNKLNAFFSGLTLKKYFSFFGLALLPIPFLVLPIACGNNDKTIKQQNIVVNQEKINMMFIKTTDEYGLSTIVFTPDSSDPNIVFLLDKYSQSSNFGKPITLEKLKSGTELLVNVYTINNSTLVNGKNANSIAPFKYVVVNQTRNVQIVEEDILDAITTRNNHHGKATFILNPSAIEGVTLSFAGATNLSKEVKEQDTITIAATSNDKNISINVDNAILKQNQDPKVAIFDIKCSKKIQSKFAVGWNDIISDNTYAQVFNFYKRYGYQGGETILDKKFGSPLPNNFVIPYEIINISSGIFEGQTLPSNFKLPPDLEIIGENAFKSAVLPQDFNLPNSLNSIGLGAFEGSRFVTNIFSNGASIGTIADRSFANLSNTTWDWKLPEGIVEIGANSFENVVFGSSFTTLPSSLRLIRANAFKGASLQLGFTIPENNLILEGMGNGQGGTSLNPFDGVVLPTGASWKDKNGQVINSPDLGATVAL